MQDTTPKILLTQRREESGVRLAHETQLGRLIEDAEEEGLIRNPFTLENTSSGE
jgi:hypothetical protein